MVISLEGNRKTPQHYATGRNGEFAPLEAKTRRLVNGSVLLEFTSAMKHRQKRAPLKIVLSHENWKRVVRSVMQTIREGEEKREAAA